MEKLFPRSFAAWWAGRGRARLGVILLLGLLAGLPVWAAFATQTARADAGGFPTPTRTFTPTPTITPTWTPLPTLTPTPLVTPDLQVPTEVIEPQAPIASPTPIDIPLGATQTAQFLVTGPQPPTPSGPLGLCGAGAIVLLLVGIVAGIVLFGRRRYLGPPGEA